MSPTKIVHCFNQLLHVFIVVLHKNTLSVLWWLADQHSMYGFKPQRKHHECQGAILFDNGSERKYFDQRTGEFYILSATNNSYLSLIDRA